jgi:hypothetical protein
MCRLDGMWCHVQPPGYRPRRQGWKLHVSATPLAAPIVLTRAAGVLLRRGCAFKFAATLRDVGLLTASRCERAAAGKFITAYPADDEHFLELAEELHHRTYGLPGPAILSDRPFAPGSLVHYRYGAFTGTTVLSNDGSFETMLETPTGELVPDSRHPWFSPPPWARDPVRHRAGPVDDAPPGSVLLGRRFRAHRAIRHANRGGVYRAVDTHTGTEVVVKHARRHVAAGLNGADVRDLLRREAEMLDRLAPLGIAPRKVALLEHDGDLFLAEEALSGATLERWVSGRVEDDRGLPLALAVELARGLLELLAAIHAEGLIWCDLNPANIMVTSEQQLRLVDLEGLVEPGVPVMSMYTPPTRRPSRSRHPSSARHRSPAPTCSGWAPRCSSW